MSRDQYTYELADTVSDIFRGGSNDPSASEIAHAHFGKPNLGGEIVEGVRKRLHKVRDILQGEDYGLNVCLLGIRYYVEHRLDKRKRKPYRTAKPVNKQEARMCLPVGQGYSGEGLWLSTGGTEDVIWQASIELGINAGGGRLKRGIDRTIAGVADGRIPSERGGELLNGARKSITTLPPLVQIADETDEAPAESPVGQSQS